MNCSVFSASKFIVTNLQLWEIGQSRVFLWIKMRVFGLIQEVGHRSESRNLPSKYCTKMNLEKTYLSIVRLKGHYSTKSYLGDISPFSICYLLSHTYSLWMSCSLCSCVTVPGISVTIILGIWFASFMWYFSNFLCRSFSLCFDRMLLLRNGMRDIIFLRYYTFEKCLYLPHIWLLVWLGIEFYTWSFIIILMALLHLSSGFQCCYE